MSRPILRSAQDDHPTVTIWTPMPTTLRRSSNPVPGDGLPRRYSTEAAGLLTERLADCIDLRTLMSQAKRNLKGASSRRFREGLSEIEADLGDYVGLLGARVLQLDGWPRST